MIAMIQMIDPFCNRTGRLLQNTSQINRWAIVIFCWEYLAMSEVGSLHKLLFYQLCQPSIY